MNTLWHSRFVALVCVAALTLPACGASSGREGRENHLSVLPVPTVRTAGAESARNGDTGGGANGAAAQAGGSEAQKQKAAVMAEARRNPKDALYWPLFYALATPGEVGEIIGGRGLSGIRTIKQEVHGYMGSGPVVQGVGTMLLPLLVFQKSFWTGTSTEKYRYTPLTVAAAVTPHPEVIHMLVKAGCRVTDLRSEAMFKALYNPNPKVLEAVLAYKPDVNTVFSGETALTKLLIERDSKEFKREHFRLMLKAGADPNHATGKGKETPLFTAAFYRNTEAGRMLLAAGADVRYRTFVGNTALDEAIGREAWDLAMDILKAGAPLSPEKGYPPLARLARIKNPDMALLRAMVKAQGQGAPETALALAKAAEYGDTAAFKAILELGAQPDARARLLGEALVFAAAARDGAPPEAIRLLIARGASPNYRNAEGMTPLHMAAYNVAVGVSEVLIKAGADVNATSNAGTTPLMELEHGRHESRSGAKVLAAMLVRAGARGQSRFL